VSFDHSVASLWFDFAEDIVLSKNKNTLHTTSPYVVQVRFDGG